MIFLPPLLDKRKKKGKAQKLNMDSFVCIGLVVCDADRVVLVEGGWEVGRGLKKLMISITNW